MGFWPLAGIVALGAMIMFFFMAEGKHIGRRKTGPSPISNGTDAQIQASPQ